MKLVKELKSVLFLLALSACSKNTENVQQPQPERFPYFGAATAFAALSAGGVSNEGQSTIYGDLGVSPGAALTGTETITRTGGTDHTNDAMATQAQTDAKKSYDALSDEACTMDLSGKDLGGVTLNPGVYCFNDDAVLNGVLVLDAQGNPNANFIFKVASNFHAGLGSIVLLVDNGETCNVLWQVAGTVSFDQDADITGAFLSIGGAVMSPGSKVNGKLLSQMGSIEIHSAQIYNNFCPL